MTLFVYYRAFVVRAPRSTTTWRQTKRRIVTRENKYTDNFRALTHVSYTCNTIFIRTNRVIIIIIKKIRTHCGRPRDFTLRYSVRANRLARLPCAGGDGLVGCSAAVQLLNADESEYLRLGLESASNDFAEFPAEKKNKNKKHCAGHNIIIVITTCLYRIIILVYYLLSLLFVIIVRYLYYYHNITVYDVWVIKKIRVTT